MITAERGKDLALALEHVGSNAGLSGPDRGGQPCGSRADDRDPRAGTQPPFGEQRIDQVNCAALLRANRHATFGHSDHEDWLGVIGLTPRHYTVRRHE